MTIQAGAPEEVVAVHEALEKNAVEADVYAAKEFGEQPSPDAARRAYTYQRGEEWIVCDNYDRGMSAMIFKGGQWFYRDFMTGADKAMPLGYCEALANAACAFTG